MSSTVCGCNPAETKIFYTGECYKDNFFISKGMEGFFRADGNKKAAGMSRRETLVKEQIVFFVFARRASRPNAPGTARPAIVPGPLCRG